MIFIYTGIDIHRPKIDAPLLDILGLNLNTDVHKSKIFVGIEIGPKIDLLSFDIYGPKIDIYNLMLMDQKQMLLLLIFMDKNLCWN